MWKIFRQYRFLLCLLLWFVAYALFLELTGIGCPFRKFLGVRCMGCGMTRAVASALRLDFAAAFTFHPAWPVLPLAAVLLAVFSLRSMKKAQNITFAVSALAILLGHLLRCALSL